MDAKLDESKLLEIRKESDAVATQTDRAVEKLEAATAARRFTPASDEAVALVEAQGKAVSKLQKTVEEFMRPIIDAARATLDAARSRRDEVIDPLEQKKKRASKAVGDYRDAREAWRREQEEAERKRLEAERQKEIEAENARRRAAEDEARKAREEAERREAAERAERERAERLASQGRQKQAEEARKRADEAARQAEQARAAQEEQEREAAEAKRAAAEAEDRPVAPVVKPALERGEGASQRKNWKFRIVDGRIIPRKFMVPDEVAIGKIVRASEGKIVIPGVEVYSENATAFSTR
jgi:hypothetical protein